MSTTAPSKSGPSPRPQPGPLPEAPPEETFWERYNRRLEFPLSTVSAVLIHVLVGAVILFGLFRLMNTETDRSSVPVKLVDVANGPDDVGLGSPGSGGQPDPLAKGDADPWKKANPNLPSPEALPQVKEEIKKLFDDPNSPLPISDTNAAAYTLLDDALKRKINGIGAHKGEGNQPGEGADGSKGSGKGGVGPNSTRARSLRWVLRFRTASGDDYVAQLAAMGAVVLVPIPPANDKCVYFTDLKNPSKQKIATDDDLKQLSDQIKFSDTRPDSVRAVCDVLGVREPAKSFWAFFPKGLEGDLAQKETGYRNRRPEDIEETVFRVIVRGGSYEIVVDDQTAKR